jgi:receptor protein-tyrosine kinase
VNLAMSIAMEMDQRVLLVDADVASPSLSGLLDLPAGPGLMDLLADTGEQPSDALLQTQVEGLSILPIGEPNARATELIASGTMRALLDSLTMRDPDLLVIFDAPPLLTTTEARELASHMGQLVVVVQAGRTSQARLRQALSVAENVPERMLVLNGVPRRRAGWDSDVGGGWGRGTPTSEEAGA